MQRKIIAVGGKAFTIISEGGEAFTLATSGFGAATSVFGSVYTVATGDLGSATSISNGASVPYAGGVQTSLLVGLGSMMFSTLLGAVITLWYGYI